MGLENLCRLKDLESVKWVIACKTRVRLDQQAIADVGEYQMTQSDLMHLDTWTSLAQHPDYGTITAIVANESTERGASLVANGLAATDNQLDGLDVCNYVSQQCKLKQLTGQCSGGCQPSSVQLRGYRDRQGSTVVEQVCRHTLRQCMAPDAFPNVEATKRIDLLERLLVQVRQLMATDSNVAHEQVAQTLRLIDGDSGKTNHV